MLFMDLSDYQIVLTASHLCLHDVIQLSRVNMRLQNLVYNNTSVWTTDHLFPEGDPSITDRFVARLVPRITRFYGIQALRLVRLPLSWAGYLRIFDQFAHSIAYIDLIASGVCLSDLIYHLSIFAGNLAMLQQDNRIPITFREYAADSEKHCSALAATGYLGQQSWRNLTPLLSSLKLDDPPFERLVQFRVSSTDHAEDENAQIHQLHFLTSFLAGKSLAFPSPQRISPQSQTHHKRSRDDELIPIPYPKHRRHDLVSMHHRPYEASSGYT
ncbi:hypothetical protein CLU79DRAFT_732904 [Phycomyces nitens]|nr:hypothetical protein CLU79DRAFT_732904 [Phycomyces nitens]